MVQAEQLSLPDLTPPANGPAALVMMLRDVHTDNPKVLMSMRLKSGRFGFPGGKLWLSERRKPSRGAQRETLTETGIPIHREYLIESRISPLRIAAEGMERDMHVFYCFSEECAPGVRPLRLEPRKHGPWRFVPVRLLPNLVSSGLLHPLAIKADLLSVVDEAQNAAPRQREYEAWMRRDREIDQEIRERRYGFLAYIHDKEAGHLVF